METIDTEPAVSVVLDGTVAAGEPRPQDAREERVLVLGATGRDAEEISAAAAGFTTEFVPDMARLCAQVAEGAGVVVLVDAGLSSTGLAGLRESLKTQPSWSDLPILAVPADIEWDAARQRMLDLVEMLEPVQVVTFMARPLVRRALVTRLAAALRVRRRQYQQRALLEQLDLEHRRQAAMLAALPVAVLMQDADGRVVHANAAVERIWGPLPAMTCTEDLRAFKAWPPGVSHDGTPFEWRHRRVLATGRPVIEEELEIEAFDGARRTILSSAYPIRDAHDNLTGVVALQVDISERARAQRAAQVLSEATAALMESLDPGVTLHTITRIVVTNLADACAIDELDEHGALRRLVAETTGGPSADEAAQLLAFVPAASGNSLAARALKARRPILVSDVRTDWLAAGLEGDEHRAAFAKIGAYSLIVLPLLAHGTALGVVGIVSTRRDRRYGPRDLALAEEISRRAAIALDNARMLRRAQAALRSRDESLTEFDAFLTTAPVGFCLLDRTLRFRRVNHVIADRLGRPADAVLGESLETVIPSVIEAQLVPLFQHVLTSGESLLEQPVVGELPPGSGKATHLLTSFFPLLDVTGTPRAVGAVFTDVTRLKEVEGELREQATFRERFIGILAHDLRAPLHAIVISVGALRRHGGAPAPWARTVGRIAHAAERMERMIGNLLDLVRSRQTGGIAIRRGPADLGVIVRNVVDELEASHPGREIAVSVAGDTHAELDAERMAEVVSNLAANALEYSPSGTPVEVDVRGQNGELALRVHNAGAPIAPSRLKTIFAPFRRGAEPGGGPSAMRGLGLGLFIVGEISRAHGGAIAVSSNAEDGTTFTVRVPRTSAEEEARRH
jgi:PAS domain S-box-containing protein